VAGQIQEAIYRGDFVPGQRLPTERELLQQFGTSRATVREALRILEQSGLVRVRPGSGGGAYVAEPSHELISDSLRQLMQLNQFRVVELHQARVALEPGIALRAAQTATPEGVALLEEALDSARRLVADGRDASSMSRRFHFLLAQATGNNLLLMLGRSLLELAAAYDAARAWTTKGAQDVLADHAALLDAVRAHQPERARQLMQDHLVGLIAQSKERQSQ
jgi:DNA-binding FadR family transcriptional regulator